MELLSKGEVGEARTGLEDIREGEAVRGEAAQKELVDEEGDGEVVEGVKGVGFEHGVAEHEVEVGVGEGTEEAGGVVCGARGGAGCYELCDEDGVVVDGLVEELSLDLLELAEAKIGMVVEEKGE